MSDAEQNTPGANRAAEAVLRGQAIYTRSVLAIYDVWVHGISNPLIWGCPTADLRRLCARHLSANHMDVGIGTGYFLARCSFPSPNPRLLLVDANETCLAVAGRRLRRYRPGLHRGNILEPLGDIGAPFDSIALMYVLHCLPGGLTEKARVFNHLNACLTATGVIFGATVLGQGVASRPIARRLMVAYNARGIFSNASDDPDTLHSVLAAATGRWRWRSRAASRCSRCAPLRRHSSAQFDRIWPRWPAGGGGVRRRGGDVGCRSGVAAGGRPGDGTDQTRFGMLHRPS